MKKLIFLAMLCFFTTLLDFSPAMAEQTSHFAKVQNSGVYLCSTPSETSSLFEIPSSYFVKVESVIDDYFKVSYNGVSGYVKKDRVTLMSGTPETPYANASFKIFVPYALYQSPSQNSSETPIDTNTTFTYYGIKNGQQVSSTNNVWYYASAVVEGQTYYGYVFSGVTDYLTPISPNNESFPVITEKDLFQSSPNSKLKRLSTGTKIMLIVAISIPCLLILYFLIKPTKIIQITKGRKPAKKERRKIRHGDYFEFDENDI